MVRLRDSWPFSLSVFPIPENPLPTPSAGVRMIELLNSFFAAATTIIDGLGGVVVNHVGDALIASFNAPLPLKAHAARAVDAARPFLPLVSEREFEGHRLRLRIGITTGLVS